MMDKRKKVKSKGDSLKSKRSSRVKKNVSVSRDREKREKEDDLTLTFSCEERGQKQ